MQDTRVRGQTDTGDINSDFMKDNKAAERIRHKDTFFTIRVIKYYNSFLKRMWNLLP